MTAQELIDKLKDYPESVIEIGYLGNIEPAQDEIMVCESRMMRPESIVIFAKPRPHKWDTGCICDACVERTAEEIVKKLGRLGKSIVTTGVTIP